MLTTIKYVHALSTASKRRPSARSRATIIRYARPSLYHCRMCRAPTMAWKASSSATSSSVASRSSAPTQAVVRNSRVCAQACVMAMGAVYTKTEYSTRGSWKRRPRRTRVVCGARSSEPDTSYLSIFIYLYIIHTYVYTNIYIYIYICIERERERERETAGY